MWLLAAYRNRRFRALKVPTPCLKYSKVAESKFISRARTIDRVLRRLNSSEDYCGSHFGMSTSTMLEQEGKG